MSRDVKAGRAYVEIVLRDKLAGGLRKAAARLRGFSTSMGAIGGTLLAGAGALAAPLIPAIKKASDYQEVMSKFDTVFGDQAKTVKTWGDGFATQVGRSKKQVAEFMAGSQDLFVPLGFDQGTATELSKTITGLAVDLASFNNMDDADALRDLHAALTGSGEVMKKYGVIVSEAAVKQELLRQGMNPKEATDQQKVQARLNLILAGTTAAQGDALRTGGSFANQMKRLKAETDNLMVSVGSALLPTLTRFASTAGELMVTATAWIGNNQGLVLTIAGVAAGLAGAGAALIVAGTAGLGFSAILAGLSTAAGALAGALALLASPFVAIPLAIAAAAVAALHFTGNLETVAGAAMAWGGGMRALFTETIGAMAGALMGGDLTLAAKILWASLKLIFQQGTLGIRQTWIQVWAGMGSLMDSVITAMRQAWTGFTTGLTTVLLKAWEQIQNLLGVLADVEEMIGIENGLVSQLKAALTIDVDAVIETLKEDSQRKERALEDARRNREDDRADSLVNQLKSTEDSLAALQKERQALLDKGNDTKPLAFFDGLKDALAGAEEELAKQPPGNETPGPDPGGGLDVAGDALGTFSGIAAARFGGRFGGKPEERTAKATERTAKATEKTAAGVEEVKANLVYAD